MDYHAVRPTSMMVAFFVGAPMTAALRASLSLQGRLSTGYGRYLEAPFTLVLLLNLESSKPEYQRPSCTSWARRHPYLRPSAIANGDMSSRSRLLGSLPRLRRGRIAPGLIHHYSRWVFPRKVDMGGKLNE
jgi:hypothetical protein